MFWRGQRTLLIALLVFGSVTAIAGMVGLLTGTLGMPDDILDGSPFTTFTIPALILGIIVGGSQLAALLALRQQRDWALMATTVAGCIMVGWIAGEVLLLGSDPGTMRNLQVICFANGLLEVILSARLFHPSHRITSPA